MYDIPQTGFLRLPQVLRFIPLGKTSWWEGVKSGRYPKPIKLSARCTAWRAEDIRELIKSLSGRRRTVSEGSFRMMGFCHMIPKSGVSSVCVRGIKSGYKCIMDSENSITHQSVIF